MKKFLYKNSLSLVFFTLFLISLLGQFFTGFAEHNKEMMEDQQPVRSMFAYLHSGHFIQATFENWESEFLQMALFVLLTISLRQKGSSESKKCDGPEEVDREPSPARKHAPWAVRKGGIILKIYKHSLTISLLMLFVLSFILHFHGSLLDENAKLISKGLNPQSVTQYLGDSRFGLNLSRTGRANFYLFLPL